MSPEKDYVRVPSRHRPRRRRLDNYRPRFRASVSALVRFGCRTGTDAIKGYTNLLFDVVALAQLLDHAQKLSAAGFHFRGTKRRPLGLPIATGEVGLDHEDAANLYAVALGSDVELDIDQRAQRLECQNLPADERFVGLHSVHSAGRRRILRHLPIRVSFRRAFVPLIG